MKSSVSKKQLREFGFLIGFGMPILVGWIIPAISGHLFRVWSLWIGVPLFILGILRPRLLFYPYQTWMKIGLALGWINSHIVLGLVLGQIAEQGFVQAYIIGNAQDNILANYFARPISIILVILLSKYSKPDIS